MLAIPIAKKNRCPFLFGEMMKQGRRRLVKIGGSVGITLPHKFLKQSQLKLGDQVVITFDDMMFAIKPVFPRETKEKE